MLGIGNYALYAVLCSGYDRREPSVPDSGYPFRINKKDCLYDLKRVTTSLWQRKTSLNCFNLSSERFHISQ